MSEKFNVTPLTREELRALVQQPDLRKISELAESLSFRELEELLTDAQIGDSVVLFRLLPKDISIEVFDDLAPAVQADIVRGLSAEQVATVFSSLDPDEQTSLIDELPARVAKQVLASVDDEDLGPAMTLLGYPQGSVGRRMSSAHVVAHRGETAGAVLQRIRSSDVDSEDLAVIPVLGSHRKLVGTVDPVILMRADSEAVVRELSDSDPVFAMTGDGDEQAAREALDRGVLSLPVVDSEQRLVGMLPISDAARIDRQAVDEDHARAGASERLRRSYIVTPVSRIARARIVWLLVLAVSAILTVNVLEIFEATIEQQVALALFVPLLIGISGNTGSQAATTVTRALALDDIELRDVGRVAFKEARTGLLLAVPLAALALSLGWLFYGFGIGAVLALTLLINLPLAATVGGVIPIVGRACKVDPAVFSTPFIATFCDASGLLVYFTVAITVLGL
ncbi:magnesium transporter [uncultured Agrococcus sp.]|uniref:magnesium transporter n=1 Tax=uncultured Agrococcus sp. TaxID=382258 RepID=UPI0025D4BEBC|nr:magnesium transporter [uncultured Agrococcus sp.]